jgi:hypothetical protein
MKLTPARRKMISFMSGPWGRLARGVVGSFLVAIALIGMGWSLLWLPLGLFMIGTGILNYCPAGLMFPEWKKEPQILANFPTHKLK